MRFLGRIDGWEGEKKKLHINTEVGTFIEEKGGKQQDEIKFIEKINRCLGEMLFICLDKGNDIL